MLGTIDGESQDSFVNVGEQRGSDIVPLQRVATDATDSGDTIVVSPPML